MFFKNIFLFFVNLSKSELSDISLLILLLIYKSDISNISNIYQIFSLHCTGEPSGREGQMQLYIVLTVERSAVL